MLLFHRSLANKDIILEKGLKGDYNTSPTYTVNKALIEAGFNEIADIRSGAVFLSDKNLINTKTILSVNISDINTDNLYVAEETVANKIFGLAMIGRSTSEHAKLYANSFVSYNDYLAKKPFIKRPEFIYVGDIPADKLTIVEEGNNSVDCIRIYTSKDMKDYIIAD